jgi:hypothetical protein
VTFGYKRAEVAFVPTGKDPGAKPGTTDAYSTLAAFRLAANWFSATKIEQFIATGHAARDIQKAPNEFTKALLADSAGTDELSAKFTKLMAEEKDGACWQALHAWRDANAKGISDFEFARLAPHQDLRAEAWRDATIQNRCQGK